MGENIARDKAVAIWESRSEMRIANLDDENYDSLLFIEDKFLEMQRRERFPVYSRDEYGLSPFFWIREHLSNSLYRTPTIS